MPYPPAAVPIPPPAGLLAEVEAQAGRSPPEPAHLWVGELRDRFGDALSAVLLYGSCLHRGDLTEGVADLYAVVREYRTAYPGRGLAMANALLPPNVFYAEAQRGETVFRAKVAVLSQEQLALGAERWFHSYVWARFAQPSRLLWARDEGARRAVVAALAHAVVRFHREVVPALGSSSGAGGTEAGAATTDVDAIWGTGLALTYASELRPEGGERVEYHLSRSRGDYALLTAAATPALADLLRDDGGGRYRTAVPPGAHRRALRRWRIRRWQGKLLSVLRLAKSAFTFSGSADYVAWKIQRHTGEPLEVTEFMRRHPLLAAPWALVHLLRRGLLK